LEQRSGVAEVIGQYMDTPIYRRIVIAGVDYEFDHIDPPGGAISRRPKERYLTPGIVCRALIEDLQDGHVRVLSADRSRNGRRP
jgi:hypothetical protein